MAHGYKDALLQRPRFKKEFAVAGINPLEKTSDYVESIENAKHGENDETGQTGWNAAADKNLPVLEGSRAYHASFQLPCHTQYILHLPKKLLQPK